jgi:Fe-S oxidoreductase
MFSNEAKKISDACRFCWMCRYVCPVGLVSGKEGNTPRGRALLLSLDTRGIKLTPDAYELMFQCVLCNACTNDCATGYEPPVFIREARTEAIVNEYVPDAVKPVLERTIAGSISGKPVNNDIERAIKSCKKKADLLLYLGDSARRDGYNSALALISILNKSNIEFSVLDDEPDSGVHLFDLMGYTSDVQDTAKACIQRIRAAGAKTIIAIDPTYARFFKHQCNEWGLMDGLKAVTATAFVSASGFVPFLPFFQQDPHNGAKTE